MIYTQIQCDVDGNTLTITLNRPERLNAFTDRVMVPELLDAFNRADEDDRIRAVIVTGAGRGFCAGHDLDEGFDYDKREDQTADTFRDPGGTLTLRIFDMKKPLIAAINGVAVGVGITMTLPMDIRLAADSARFGFVFSKLGIVMEACSTWFLPRIVGISKACEWAFSGRIFGSEEALASGLVTEVLKGDQLMNRARELADEIARNTSAISVPLNRQLLWKMLGAEHPLQAHKLESKCIYSLGSKPDATEAVSAFFQKRPPQFTMKPSVDMPPFYPWWKEK
jgi:enoyl-CoA hydratase/carnithine racemase